MGTSLVWSGEEFALQIENTGSVSCWATKIPHDTRQLSLGAANWRPPMTQWRPHVLQLRPTVAK